MILPLTCTYAQQGAYVLFRGSEFHTRNARSWQWQEQRRAKAHSRQAKFDRLTTDNSLGFQPQAGEQFQAVELSLTAMGFSPTLFLGLPKSSIPCMKFTSPKLYIRPCCP